MNRQSQQKALETNGVVQHLILQGGNRAELLIPNDTPDSTSERGQSVVPEVESVLPVDSFQEQIDFCLFESRRIVHLKTDSSNNRGDTEAKRETGIT